MANTQKKTGELVPTPEAIGDPEPPLEPSLREKKEALEFFTKASVIYLMMVALGLVVIRYGHKNLAQILPWSWDKELRSLSSGSSELPLWMGEAGNLTGIAKVSTYLAEVFSTSPGTMTIFLVAIFCSFLCALVTICLAFLFTDMTRPVVTGTQSGKSDVSLRQGLTTDDYAFEATLDSTFSAMMARLSHFQLCLLAFFTACGEEILFRGAIQPYLGLLMTSVLYGLIHLGPGGIGNAINVLGFIRGLLLGWVFIATQNLWICIFAEFLFNLYSLFESRRNLPRERILPVSEHPSSRDA